MPKCNVIHPVNLYNFPYQKVCTMTINSCLSKIYRHMLFTGLPTLQVRKQQFIIPIMFLPRRENRRGVRVNQR